MRTESRIQPRVYSLRETLPHHLSLSSRLQHISHEPQPTCQQKAGEDYKYARYQFVLQDLTSLTAEYVRSTIGEYRRRLVTFPRYGGTLIIRNFPANG